MANGDASDPRSILNRAWEASGGPAWDEVKALHWRVKMSASGLSGSGEIWEDVRSGRFTVTFSLGPLSGARGFDGTAAWAMDGSGQVRVQEGGDAREAAVNDAYRRSLSWWYPDRRAATLSDAGVTEEDGQRFHRISIHPEGGHPFELWIHAGTGLVDRFVEPGSMATQTTFFSDYRQVDGVRLPFGRRTTVGDPRFDQVYEVESIEVNPPLDEARLRRPGEQQVRDFEIAGGRTSTDVPFRLLENHIFLEASLNGHGPLLLLFDSGGANVVTPETAARMGLPSQGSLQGIGAGEGTVEVGLTRVQELRMGDVVLRGQVFYVIPLGDAATGEEVDIPALIGYEVFKRFAVRIDYERQILTFTLPEAFQEPAGATEVPFVFHGRFAQVAGEVDGILGQFVLDTGSRGSLTIHTPFAEEHDLAGRYAPRFETLIGKGLGGGVRGAVTRAGLLKMGNVEVPAPVTFLARQQKGAFADRSIAGNVGGGILRRFTVTFDYPRQRVFFEPNGSFGREDAYDRSGLRLRRMEDGFEIEEVIPASPAGEAGLQAGDRIVEIDGRAASEVSLSDLRAYLRESPTGTEVRFVLRSGGEAREVRLTLRDLL